MATPVGLDQKKLASLSSKLNQLLASYQVLYMNVRGYHWNIRGPEFFELHDKFEEIYNDLLVKIDDIAERILTLGVEVPLHTFQHYLQKTTVQVDGNTHEAVPCVQGLANGFNQLITLEREIVKQAADADDEGTASQLSDYIKEQEKLLWMFNAYLSKSVSS